MGRIVRYGILLAVLWAVVASGQDDKRAASPQSSAQAAEPTPATTPVFQPTRKQRGRHRAALAALTATPTATATPKPSPFVDCDSNIRAREATTTCPFASNVFYEYFAATGGYPTAATVSAWSPAGKQYYDVTCTARIVCKAGDGAEIRFPATAIESYDEDQAAAYANAHDVGPNTDDPASSDPYTDDDDYEDDYALPDEEESSSAPDQRIPNYEDGNGYPVQCADGMWSKSGGIQGACSGHGGVG